MLVDLMQPFVHRSIWGCNERPWAMIRAERFHRVLHKCPSDPVKIEVFEHHGRIEFEQSFIYLSQSQLADEPLAALGHDEISMMKFPVTHQQLKLTQFFRYIAI
ncbi:hypothetical protein LM602_04495 [Candidatus Acetothermia bacterium]|nr:hypothetical protein [Candidatus Acetothermia bacterium]MCI2431801.1 hypothetical protein [Candidatus Acetothermia bacterium]MCI2437199.1 hypothetical protein [Candidatus Acetothermia bacterium]